MRKAVAILAIGLVCSFAAAQELFNNGGYVTHPGKGFGGKDASMASLNPNSGGSNMKDTYNCADDFTVPGDGWVVNKLMLHGYATNAPPGVPGWTGYELKIWKGAKPGEGTPVYQTTGAPVIKFTDCYRVFNGSTNLTNTARALNSLTWAIPDLQLAGGQYWFDLRVTGGSSGWMNYVMIVDPNAPDNPITKAGNAYQFTGSSWVPAVAGSPAVNVEFPFVVYGVPEPTALALMVLGLVIRRR